MPLLTEWNFTAPDNEEKFERLVEDALKVRHENAHLIRLGRRGQRQYGVDGFDPLADPGTGIAWQATLLKRGVFAKLREDLRQLDLNSQINPALFVCALGLERDERLQTKLYNLSTQRAALGLCRIQILFWSEIRDILFSHPHLHRKWFLAESAHQPAEDVPEEHDNDDVATLTCLFCGRPVELHHIGCAFCGAEVRDNIIPAEEQSILLRSFGSCIIGPTAVLVALPEILQSAFTMDVPIGLGAGPLGFTIAGVGVLVATFLRARQMIRREQSAGLRWYRRRWTDNVLPSGRKQMGLQVRTGTPERYASRWVSRERELAAPSSV